jgi:hypothetical protein
MASSMRNTSLYGRSPQNGRGHAAGSRFNPPGPATGGMLVKVTPDSTDEGAAGKGAGASGVANTTVPPQYQKRVGEYFRRVSDDMEQP